MVLSNHVCSPDFSFEEGSFSDSRQVDPDNIIDSLWNHPGKHHPSTHHGGAHHYTYGTRYSSQQPIPKFHIPNSGTDGGAVRQMIRDELDLDGKPNLNLASFVGTYMEPNADQLMMENIVSFPVVRST